MTFNSVFGLLFIAVAFTCYHYARKYQAHDAVLTIASILAFVVGLGLLAFELFRGS